MLVRNLKLNWADLQKIHIKDIGDEVGRKFAAEVIDQPRHVTVDVYLCSDGRNQGVRQVLNQIPFVNVMNVAGNVVYNPNERPTVVIAHGNSERRNCGAVDHARDCAAGQESRYSAIASLVADDPIKNAQAQLEKVPEKYRAGIIYYDHADSRVEYMREINRSYARKSYCKALYEELFYCLKDLYTDSDKALMAEGQNPEIILLSGAHFNFTVYSIFRVDLQRDLFQPIIKDSLAYAVENSLTGSGSFSDTRNVFMVFRKNRKLPEGLEGFLNQADFLGKYIKRGGHVYIVTVGDLPSEKTIFRLDPH